MGVDEGNLPFMFCPIGQISQQSVKSNRSQRALKALVSSHLARRECMRGRRRLLYPTIKKISRRSKAAQLRCYVHLRGRDHLLIDHSRQLFGRFRSEVYVRVRAIIHNFQLNL